MKGRVLIALLGVFGVGVAWEPVARPLEPVTLESAGVGVVRHLEHDRIDGVLLKRGPGLGSRLRQQLTVAIAQEADRAHFDPLLVLAVIAVESEFHETAVSNVGARGLMQIRPTTLYFFVERQGLKLSRAEIEADPALRVRLGVRYLSYLRDRFGGDIDLALMAYNAGPTRIATSMRHRGGLEPFRNYVRAVRRQYTALRQAHGEMSDWAFASRDVRPSL